MEKYAQPRAEIEYEPLIEELDAASAEGAVNMDEVVAYVKFRRQLKRDGLLRDDGAPRDDEE